MTQGQTLVGCDAVLTGDGQMKKTGRKGAKKKQPKKNRQNPDGLQKVTLAVLQLEVSSAGSSALSAAAFITSC